MWAGPWQGRELTHTHLPTLRCIQWTVTWSKSGWIGRRGPVWLHGVLFSFARSLSISLYLTPRVCVCVCVRVNVQTTLFFTSRFLFGNYKKKLKSWAREGLFFSFVCVCVKIWRSFWLKLLQLWVKSPIMKLIVYHDFSLIVTFCDCPWVESHDS